MLEVQTFTLTLPREEKQFTAIFSEVSHRLKSLRLHANDYREVLLCSPLNDRCNGVLDRPQKSGYCLE